LIFFIGADKFSESMAVVLTDAEKVGTKNHSTGAFFETGGTMYKVMIRVGEKQKMKRATFETAEAAEAYYDKLCQTRTEYPATVVLAYKILVKKRYRIDKDWAGERVLLNEDLAP
jgi:uncharacterized protein YaaQ